MAPQATPPVPSARPLSADCVPGLVSVIIPVHNRVHLIGETLDSVLGQTYGDLEAVVVDDGSTDDTGRVIARYAAEHGPDRVRRFTQDHRGASCARNLGMARSRGEFIQFLDSDDLLAGEKIAVQVSALRRHPEYDLAVGEVLEFENPEALPEAPPGRARRVLPFDSYSGERPFYIQAPLYRRSALREVGAWDESLSYAEESNFAARVLLAGLVSGRTPDALAYYRQHPRNMRRALRREEELAGTLRAYEGVLDEAERAGSPIPAWFRLKALICRSRLRALRGDAGGARGDLKEARALLAPGHRRRRAGLAARGVLLRFLGARGYTLLFDAVHRLARRW